MTMVMIDGKIDEAYSPGGEATRMTTVMVVVVDEIAEAYDFRNCDGRHDHGKENQTEKERKNADGRCCKHTVDSSPCLMCNTAFWV